MALKYDLPVIPMVFTYRKPKGIYKILKINHPLITLNIGTPVLPCKDEELTSKRRCTKMLLKTHRQMTEMAGITQNMWDALED